MVPSRSLPPLRTLPLLLERGYVDLNACALICTHLHPATDHCIDTDGCDDDGEQRCHLREQGHHCVLLLTQILCELRHGYRTWTLSPNSRVNETMALECRIRTHMCNCHPFRRTFHTINCASWSRPFTSVRSNIADLRLTSVI